jgi:hypothetical protein
MLERGRGEPFGLVDDGHLDVILVAVADGLVAADVLGVSISRPARPLSASTVLPGGSAPVSAAMVSRSRQASRSPIFESARHQAIGIPSAEASR